MRLRRNIKVNHYALNEKGAPVSVTPSSQSLEGPKFHILNKNYVCHVCPSVPSYNIACPSDDSLPPYLGPLSSSNNVGQRTSS